VVHLCYEEPNILLIFFTNIIYKFFTVRVELRHGCPIHWSCFWVSWRGSQFVGILFSDGRLEIEIGRPVGVLSALMRALLWSVVVERKLSWKSKLSIYWSTFVPTPHLWSQDLGSDRKREFTATPPHQKRSVEVVRGIWLGCRLVASLWKFSRYVPTGRRPRSIPRTHLRDYISLLAWECLGIPQEELESVAGERDIWVCLLNLSPPLPNFR